MTVTRIFQTSALSVDTSVQLDAAASHHVQDVLRARCGDELIIFDGTGGEYRAHITALQKKRVTVHLDAFNEIERESPLIIHLGQGVARGEKMDWILQKATELGVTEITPLWTEFGNVQLSAERVIRKMEHWQKIIISACEQSGRTRIPILHTPVAILNWFSQVQAPVKLLLHPAKQQQRFTLPATTTVCLAVGSEGGFSQREMEEAQRHQFQSVQLGPRILRTETAGLAAIAMLQQIAGDF